MEFQGKSDVITAALRELIITGQIEAGAPLRQRDLAARFGVSPTPVREALRRLEAEGLVSHGLHRGATVLDAVFDPDEDGYRMRLALESLAARIAASRITDDEVGRLEALHQEFRTRRTADPHIPEVNRQFHFALYCACRSPVLLALLRLLWQSYRQSPQLIRPHAQSVHEHEAILEALRRHDPDAAEQHMREHIGSALRIFLALRAAGVEGTTTRATAQRTATRHTRRIAAAHSDAA